MSAQSPVAAVAATNGSTPQQDQTKPLTWAQRLAGKAGAASLPQTQASSLRPNRSGVPATPVPAVHSRNLSIPRQTATGGSNGLTQANSSSPASGGTSRPAGPSSTAGGKIRIPTNTSISAASVTTESSWTGSQSESGNGSSNLTSQTTTNSSADISAATSVADTDARSPALSASTDTSPQKTLPPSSSRTLSTSDQAKHVIAAIESPSLSADPETAVLQAAATSKPPSGPPKVNVWQRRKEEQALKAAEQAAQKSAAVAAAAVSASSSANKAAAPLQSRSDELATAGSASTNKLTASMRDRSTSSATQASSFSAKKPSAITTNTQNQTSHRQRGSSITSQSANNQAAVTSQSIQSKVAPPVAAVTHNRTANASKPPISPTSTSDFKLNPTADLASALVKAEVDEPAQLPDASVASSAVETGPQVVQAITVEPAETVRSHSQAAETAASESTSPAAIPLAPTPISKDTNMIRSLSQASSRESGQAKRKGKNRSANASPEIVTTSAPTASAAPLASPSALTRNRTTPSPSGLTSLHASLPAKPLGAITGPSKQRTSPNLLGQTGMRSPGMRSPIPSSRSPVSPRNGSNTPASTSQIASTTPESQAVFAALPPNATHYGDIRLLPPDANLPKPQQQPFTSPSIAHNRVASPSGGPYSASTSPIDGSMRGGKRGVSSVRGRGSAYYGYPNNGDRSTPRRFDRQTEQLASPSSYRSGPSTYNSVYAGGMRNVSQYGPDPYSQNGSGISNNAYYQGPPGMGQQQMPIGYAGPGMSQNPYSNFPNYQQPQHYHLGQQQMFQPNFLPYQSALASTSQTSSPRTGPRDLPGMQIPAPMPMQMQYNGAQTYSPSVDTQSQFTNGDAASVQSPVTFARPAPLYDYSHIAFPPDGAAFWVLGQLEYYFSPDNLIRDPFLRNSMDSGGWVDIPLIASFKRITQLTMDFNLVRDMCGLSAMLELRESKVRRAGDWPQWVLPDARPPSWQYAGNMPAPTLSPALTQPASTAAGPATIVSAHVNTSSAGADVLQPS